MLGKTGKLTKITKIPAFWDATSPQRGTELKSKALSSLGSDSARAVHNSGKGNITFDVL